MTAAFGKGLLAIKGVRLKILGNEVGALRGGLDRGGLVEDAYRQQLAHTQMALDVLGSLRRSHPTGTACDPVDAHDTPVLAIDSSDSSRTAFLKLVGDFADKISVLETAMKALSPGISARNES